ncbi:MAG: hypothetical protein ABW189_08895 [Rickettsiales bacterium]
MKILALALVLSGAASGAYAATFNQTGAYGQLSGFGTRLSDQDVTANGVK